VKHRARGLTDEDRILWHRIARTVKPLPGVAVPENPETPEPAVSVPPVPAGTGKPPKPQAPFQPFLPPYIPPVSKPRRDLELDDPTHRKIAREKLAIDARIDLHSMTQADAHGTLLAFLHRTHASGQRHVLVITGKGRLKAGDGVLRRAVPGWFATAPFRGLVSAWATAAHHHGGDGALYVRLRK
jgi:DNA-nicking Smr family endonuclease